MEPSGIQAPGADAQAPPTDIPTDLPTELPSDLPTPVETEGGG
jgi:hypothetical protein